MFYHPSRSSSMWGDKIWLFVVYFKDYNEVVICLQLKKHFLFLVDYMFSVLLSKARPCKPQYLIHWKSSYSLSKYRHLLLSFIFCVYFSHKHKKSTALYLIYTKISNPHTHPNLQLALLRLIPLLYNDEKIYDHNWLGGVGVGIRNFGIN